MKQGGLVALLVSVVTACGDNNEGPPPEDARPDTGPTATVARGRYIMNVLGACTFCHTPLKMDGTRDMTKLFAGWGCGTGDAIPFLDIDPPTNGVGCLNARNLTPHATGIANVTDAQLRASIRDGVRTDGKIMSPVMPYWLFHNMTDIDVDSIIKYMRTLTPVDNLVPPNEEPWLSLNNNDTSSPLCNGGTCTATPIPEASIPMPVAGTANMESATRGRYLSGMVGLCVDCHSPDNGVPQNGQFPPFFPTPVQPDRLFAGGRTFFKEQLGLVDPSYPNMIVTRNITPDATGLAGWTTAQLETAIAFGKDREGDAVCAATHGNMISPYAGLEDQDLEDIANYIASIAPTANNTGPDCKGPAVP